MPIYGFQCKKCGEKFTLLLSISQKSNAACPRCQSKDLKEDFSGYGSASLSRSNPPAQFT
ncbi:MAG: zinc ribbon domain-containing protein [Firmicutes bacterium]|nr:zinc ribbon domain-containing protein [Bacillota bacterium]HOB34732.1 zinc ribbon domain-containing protein [Bacillota bacterium]HPZ90488.1 zinc ribbon domain-containing protein [Bacillota bacterium]HQE02323.1 zinc ribbon domain-containing protein [Bacillota bacterium]